MKRVISAVSMVLGIGLVQMGCRSIEPVGSPAHTLEQTMAAEGAILWPRQYQPDEASFFVSNAIDIDAPAERVWSILVQAQEWPQWYVGAEEVVVMGSPSGVLSEQAVFTWKTMGLRFQSEVKEWRPPYRLAWESRKSVIQGYHAWLLIPTEQGCRLITQEAQHGVLAVLQSWFLPNKLERLHDVWLAEIKRKAEVVE